MVKIAKKPVIKKQTTKKQPAATKKHAAMKQGRSAPQVSKALEEATTLAIKMHWRALKELEKH